MKTIAALLLVIGLLTLSLSLVQAAVSEPICIVPCDPPIYDASTLPILCASMMDEKTELLGVTHDGYYIVRHKGKIYVVVPKPEK